MDHGTGKTTITKFLVEIYNREELKIEIAAPTGKAAKIISEVTGHTASTVHRLLEIGKYEDSSIEKIFLDIKPIYADIVIIDEASMMDTYLITYIVRAVQKGTRLVIIGDIYSTHPISPLNTPSSYKIFLLPYHIIIILDLHYSIFFSYFYFSEKF